MCIRVLCSGRLLPPPELLDLGVPLGKAESRKALLPHPLVPYARSLDARTLPISIFGGVLVSFRL